MSLKNKSINPVLARENQTTLLLIGILVVCFVLMGGIAPTTFLTPANMNNMGLQLAETGVYSLAFFVVIVCGGFNMACVSIGNLSAIAMGIVSSGPLFTSLIPNESVRLGLGLVTCLLTGALCGCLIAFFVTKFKLVPLMVTSAISQLFEGTSMILTKGQNITTHRVILKVGNYNLFGIVPLLFVITAVCFVVIHIYLNKLKIGEQSQLLGINRFASLYSGNNNTKITYMTYVISGCLSAISGLIVFAKYGSIKADYGIALGSTLLLVVMLGGVTLAGGGGRVFNVFIALAITQVISTGLNLAGASVYLTKFLLGVLLLVVILANTGVMKKVIDLVQRLIKPAPTAQAPAK